MGLYTLYRLGELKQNNWKIIFSVFIAIQSYFIANTLSGIYTDTSAKYSFHSIPRHKNPYFEVAQKVIQQYQTGDTLLIPSNTKTVYSVVSQHDDQNGSRLLDAQYLTIYLPPNATYIEKIDASEPDKLILFQKKTNTRIVLFNFEGLKYRY